MNLMSLSVVDEEDVLVGTLALYEIVEWFKRSIDMRGNWEYQVKDLMVRQIITVKPEQPMQDLVPYFVECSFNYIPVVKNTKMVGIISRADMIAGLNQLLIVYINHKI